MRGAGLALLALMTLLVALLALMLSFSLWLRATVSEQPVVDPVLVAGLAVLGVAYGIQAWAVWTFRRWTRVYIAGLLLVLTLAGLAEAGRNELLALGTVLVFGLAFVTSATGLLALHAPRIRAQFRR